MSIDKEITRETVESRTATAVSDRPVRAARGARAVPTAPRPERTARRGAPPRPVARTTAPASPMVKTVESTPRTPPRTPFVLLVVGLLCGGLVSLLLLNTVLAQDSFRMNDLRDSTQRLHQEAQDLNTNLLIKSQPGNVARQVRNPGFKPDNGAPEFIDPAKGLEPGSPAGSRENPAGSGTGAPQAEVTTR